VDAAQAVAAARLYAELAVRYCEGA
jgi:hypothetical protein